SPRDGVPQRTTPPLRFTAVPTGGPSTVADAQPDAETVAGGASTTERRRIAAFDRRFPRGRAMLLLTFLVLALNVTTVFKVTRVSVIDERYWIDHLLHGADFSIDRGGVPIEQETVREL